MISDIHSEGLQKSWKSQNPKYVICTNAERKMKKHTAIYLSYFGYDTSDWIQCEVPDCGKQCIDIHHLVPRSRGGKDNIENLIGLCRDHHHEVHFGTKLKNEYLIMIHQINLNR